MKHSSLVNAVSLCASATLTMVSLSASAAPGAETSGAYLARAADCIACHSVPNGKPFAGGLKMGTPLGNIFSTNITPDKETGIGNYSLSDFDRAVRKGVAKDGHHLYPAMPYPSYAKISDGDLAALYRFFMNDVSPVHQKNPPSEIKWPVNARWPLAVWNAMFVNTKPYVADTSHDAVWNRGAYLIQGLGHCGACHTPRGVAFEESALDGRDSAFLGGAAIDGWTASDLRGDFAAGLGRWDEADVVAFLKEGRNRHAAVFGPMIDVYNNSTQFLSDEDLHAMASYLKSLPPAAANDRAYAYDDAASQALRAGDTHATGAKTYRSQCASCHGIDGKGVGAFFPPLAGNPNVLAANPSSVINLILNGAERVVSHGMPDSYRMAPYRLQLNDQEIADVSTFIRGAWGNKAGEVSTTDVASLRTKTDMSSDQIIVLQMK
jgi:mono/diheme cytochrome c family protein